MTISWLLKPRFISILIATFMALHMTVAMAGKTHHGNRKVTDSTISYAAIITGTDSASITEDDDPDFDNLLEVKGRLRASDRNSGESRFLAETINGNYGNFVIASKGHWYYAAENSQSVIQDLDNGDTLTDKLIISSIDGTTHAVVIAIKGLNEENITDTNYAASISGADSGSVTEDNDPDADNLLEVSGKLNITDNNTGEAAFIAEKINGNYGSLTIDAAGNWYYAASNSQTVIQNLASGNTLKDNLTVSSIDGTTHTVVITVIGADEANQAAVISGVDSASVTEDIDPDADNLLEVSGKLNITDSDTGEAAFIAKTHNGNYGSLTINAAGNWNYAANNSQSAIQNLASGASIKDNLTVSSVDGTTKTVVITIIGADEAGTLADINLSWVAPSEREDNTSISLSDIAGYKIYYGTTQGLYPSSVSINDSTAEGHTFTNFASNTYYFVVTTLDTEGRESQYSSEVKVVI
jgi:VCBS repeat-containing protein